MSSSKIDGVTVILVGDTDEGMVAENICDILRQAGFKRAVDTRDSRRREMVFVLDSLRHAQAKTAVGPA